MKDLIQDTFLAAIGFALGYGTMVMLNAGMKFVLLTLGY